MRRNRWTALAGLVALAACASAGVPAGPPDAAVEQAMRRATTPPGPLRIVFDWRARERDGRFNGRGVARLEPPDRARLDLFGPRGEGLLSAAVVGRRVHLPPLDQTLDLPPPAMLWGTLGVVAPPPEARLVGTGQTDGRTRLTYAVGDGRLWYDLEDGRLRGVRWEGPGRRLSVTLEGAAGHGAPARAVFRDHEAYVELVLDVEQVDDVDPYPDEIWYPGR